MTAAQPRAWTAGPYIARGDAIDGGGRRLAYVMPHRDRYYRHVTIHNGDGSSTTRFAPATVEGEARVLAVEAEQVATAKLFAAAPDLYEALNILVENDGQLSFEEHGLAMQTARAALAKSTTQE